jgi:acetyl esterase
MPLDPRLQPVIDAMAAGQAEQVDLPVAELRARAHKGMESMFLSLGDELPAAAAEEDHQVEVPGGHITVRTYRPDLPGALPAHVYFHGGGFWLGTLDHFDSSCRATAIEAGCVVASVDYRLAPEHKYPTAPDDCYAALQWVVDNAASLGVDPGRVSVGGGSAGGNLAAVVALMARDRGRPRIVFQLLEIPVTDFTLSQPSMTENSGYMLTKEGIEQCRSFYLPDEGRATEPYASPLLAPDLTGLPAALVMTAEFDPLRDEGEAYARRLDEAGVPVTLRRWDGQFHGSQNMSKLIPDEAREYRAMVAAALRSAYDRAGAPAA